MTREEAIKILKDCELNPCVSEDREAVNMAIEALKQEPILDKIRMEVENKEHELGFKTSEDVAMKSAYIQVLKIIDKYKKQKVGD